MADVIMLNSAESLTYEVPQDGNVTLYGIFSYHASVHQKITLVVSHPHTQVQFIIVMILHNNAHVVLETKQHHQAAFTTSNVMVRAVAYEQAHFDYNSLIRIEECAQRSQANQACSVLILGDAVRASAQPALEVLADDVQCKHGSAFGAPDEHRILYALSRGMAMAEARDLIVDGFCRQVLIHPKAITQYEQCIYKK